MLVARQVETVVTGSGGAGGREWVLVGRMPCVEAAVAIARAHPSRVCFWHDCATVWTCRMSAFRSIRFHCSMRSAIFLFASSVFHVFSGPFSCTVPHHTHAREMACMTLKRPFEVLKGSPVHGDHDSPLAKRKRCGPPLQPSLPASPARVKRFKRMLEFEEEAASAQWTSPSASPFAKVLSPIDSGTYTLAPTPPLTGTLTHHLSLLTAYQIMIGNEVSLVVL